MQLQRDCRTGADGNALGLVVRTRIDALVVTPWPVDACVQVNFFALLRTQLFDDLFNVLHVVPAGLESGLQISAFGEDEAGELYLTSFADGTLYRLVSNQ